MDRHEKTKKMLMEHYGKYPRAEIGDLFKFLHQSTFGCEHMVLDLNKVTEGICEEHAEYNGLGEDIEGLDGEYSRIGLSLLNKGLDAKTLAKLFFLSAKEKSDGVDDLEKKLGALKELAGENKLPFSSVLLETEITEWRKNGFSAVRHSERFRKEYNPSYRVISNKYLPFLPLFSTIDKTLKQKSVALAIEGASASGKSTLGELLKEIYDCNLFHMDDFFLRPEQRSPERYAAVGGNIDHERFLEEVLLPLKRNETVNYRRFDCLSLTLMPSIEIPPKRLTVIEGVYSMHPQLREHYDLSVFLDVSPEMQKERIQKRNTPQMAKRFFNEWIPLEKTYFEQTQAKERCDIIIPTCKSDL